MVRQFAVDGEIDRAEAEATAVQGAVRLATTRVDLYLKVSEFDVAGHYVVVSSDHGLWEFHPIGSIVRRTRAKPRRWKNRVNEERLMGERAGRRVDVLYVLYTAPLMRVHIPCMTLNTNGCMWFDVLSSSPKTWRIATTSTTTSTTIIWYLQTPRLPVLCYLSQPSFRP